MVLLCRQWLLSIELYALQKDFKLNNNFVWTPNLALRNALRRKLTRFFKLRATCHGQQNSSSITSFHAPDFDIQFHFISIWHSFSKATPKRRASKSHPKCLKVNCQHKGVYVRLCNWKCLTIFKWYLNLPFKSGSNHSEHIYVQLPTTFRGSWLRIRSLISKTPIFVSFYWLLFHFKTALDW